MRRNLLSVDIRLQTPIALHAKFEIRGFTALLGRSGAGKTSLLKALAGLLPAAGTPWEGIAPEARAVGYLPQNAGLFPHLSVLENVAYPLRGPDRFIKAQNLLDELALSDLAPRPAAAISGGQAQRIALARALARGVKLLLLDEPSAALDATTRDSNLTWLIDTLTAREIPTLAATHDPAIAGLADWLVLLADHRIIQQGTPRELFDNPQLVAAAELLGFENIWTDNNNTYAIRAAEVEIAGAADREIAGTGTPAIITSVREHGAGLRLECSAPHPLIIHLASGAKTDFTIGQTVRLRFNPARLKRLGA